MTPRPIHRWKSFWFGVFVACFLVWARWDSWRTQTFAQAPWGGGVIGLVRQEGVALVFQGWLDPFNAKVVMRAPRISSVLIEEDYLVSVERRYFKIHDSLVCSTFAGLWAAWLAWRWRRQRKRMRQLSDLTENPDLTS